MQNFSRTHRAEIRDRDEISVPAGRGKTSFIDGRDIAEVAVRALTDEAADAYDLTGSEALDYDDAAEIFSEVLGRPITYRDPSLWTFYRRKRAEGVPLGYVLIMAALYTTALFGLADRVSDDFEAVMGQEPRSLREFVEDNRENW